jgi:hypothetical protein
MTHYIKTAEYFEGRAKRARHEDERVRFLAAAQKYRDKALQDRTGTEGVTERPAIYPPPSGVSPRRFMKKVCS